MPVCVARWLRVTRRSQANAGSVPLGERGQIVAPRLQSPKTLSQRRSTVRHGGGRTTSFPSKKPPPAHFVPSLSFGMAIQRATPSDWRLMD